MASQFEAQLHRLRRGFSAVEYVYMSHDRWPLSRRQTPTGPRLNISVLDSSFNPPTLAHLALAETSFPQPSKSTSSSFDNDGFHAKLLLLSVRNADKWLRSSDATHAQRLEMMILLAEELSAEGIAPSVNRESTGPPAVSDNPNVAVAIIDEPTFVGKSNALLKSLHERIAQLSGSVTPETDATASSRSLRPKLTFLVGMDTLDRIFSPRYYPSDEIMRSSLRRFFSPDADDSRLICARRLGMSEDPAVVEIRTLAAAKEFIDSQRIVLVNMDETVAVFSSSEVREKINAGQDRGTWTSLVPHRIANFIIRNELYTHLTPSS